MRFLGILQVEDRSHTEKDPKEFLSKNPKLIILLRSKSKFSPNSYIYRRLSVYLGPKPGAYLFSCF